MHCIIAESPFALYADTAPESLRFFIAITAMAKRNTDPAAEAAPIIAVGVIPDGSS